MTAHGLETIQCIPFTQRLWVARHNLSKEVKRLALGELLQLYRDYLRELAGRRLDSRLRRRIGIADLVQETMLAALRDFHQFRGTSEPEWMAWLRSVLGHCMGHVVEKHVYTQKRDIRREVLIETVNAQNDKQSLRLSHWIVDRSHNPSEIVESRELKKEMEAKLAKLPPRDRELIILRNLQGKSFNEIASKMGMRSGTARMAWMRAIARFREICLSP
ncbi:MAG: sigma-70 family RNA polymerase sigma factor [Planctomycetota bacterium]